MDNYYHKIDTVFERDMEGTKKLIEGKYRSQTVEMFRNIDWIWTEKVDGTNTRIIWDGHKVTFGGRTPRTNFSEAILNALGNIFGGETNEQMFEQMFGSKEVIIFGETYGGNVQGNAGYGDEIKFIIFDIMVNGRYLDWEYVVQISNALNVPVVPVLLVGSIDQAVALVKNKPISKLGTKPEGVVGKPKINLYDSKGNRIIVKVKTCDFV